MNKMNENPSPVEPTNAAVGGSSYDKSPAEIISVAETAAILGVSATAIYALTKQPYTDFPSFRLGKRILIPCTQLGEWLRRELAKPSA